MNYPKPKRLKEIQGTYRSDRDVENAMGDNLEVIEIPDPPETLDSNGRSQWQIVCKRLHTVGILHDVSLSMIENFCICHQNVKAAQLLLQTMGYYTEDGKISPAFRVLMESQKEMRAIASHFGFTPATATKLPLPKKKELNAFEKLKRSSGGN